MMWQQHEEHACVVAVQDGFGCFDGLVNAEAA